MNVAVVTTEIYHALCTALVFVATSDACFNPFKTGDEDQDEVEEEGEADVEDDEETGHLDRAFGSDDEWE